MEFTEGDQIQNMTITRVSKRFCFFGDQRMSKKAVEKLVDSGEKSLFRLSPNTSVDWSLESDVIDYHNSFTRWNTYISGGSKKFEFHKAIMEVKGGLVNYNGEFYLPAPISEWDGKQNWWNSKQENLKDGKYNITLLKQENNWWPKELVGDRKNITLNLFLLGTEVKTSVTELKANTKELWAAQHGHPINFIYNQSIWDGLSFNLRDLDTTKLFQEYFVAQRWGTDLNIDISENEIRDIMSPIKNELADILKTALEYRKFHIDIDESWGEISIPNMLKFDNSVATEVFGLITDRIRQLQT